METGRKSVRMGILRGLSRGKNHVTSMTRRKGQSISRLHESADTHRKALAGRERVFWVEPLGHTFPLPEIIFDPFLILSPHVFLLHRSCISF